MEQEVTLNLVINIIICRVSFILSFYCRHDNALQILMHQLNYYGFIADWITNNGDNYYYYYYEPCAWSYTNGLMNFQHLFRVINTPRTHTHPRHINEILLRLWKVKHTMGGSIKTIIKRVQANNNKHHN